MSNSQQSAINKKINIVFMGTPQFSCPALQSLINNPDFQIIGVFTQPDRPIGRKQIITFPPVKTLVVKYGLPVFQPLKIKTEIETIKSLAPDLIVVIAYGQIIPQKILDIPAHGGINVHASLLPKYRGAACLNAPILNGDDRTGVTVMMMEAGLDTGPILRQTEIRLQGNETLELLHDRLSQIGASMLPETIKDFLAGNIKPQPQDDKQSSYVKTLKKEDGHINWHKDATAIERMIRAYNPWPGTFANKADGKMLKILAVEHQPLAINAHRPGTLFSENRRLLIQCGQDSLVVLKLQIAGGKPLKDQEFLAGHSSLINSVLN